MATQSPETGSHNTGNSNMSFSAKCTVDCVVCTENFNKTTRKVVVCGYCQYAACRTCCRTYILSSYQDPHCMQCRKPWSRAMMCDNFTQTFITTEYRNHRENVLFEKEQALMAYTQPYVEMAIRADKYTERISAKNNEIGEINAKISELVVARRQIEDDQANLRERREHCLNPDSVKKPERAQFMRKCTALDCRGFLSAQWKCGVCNLWSCPECLEVKGDRRDIEHVCDPGTLATAKLIAADTKLCPKCNTGIYKTEGCNVMFCVECHTAFDWRTRAIITKNIHNPHYFEWRARERAGEETRTHGDVICGRELDQDFAVQLSRDCKILAKLSQTTNSMESVLSKTDFGLEFYKDRGWPAYMVAIVRTLMELQEHILPREETNNLQLRITYMRNKITIDQLKQSIQQRERNAEKEQEISQIYAMVVQCAIEILYLLKSKITLYTGESPDYAKAIPAVAVAFSELEALREYANQCLKDVSRVFNGSVKLLGVCFALGVTVEKVPFRNEKLNRDFGFTHVTFTTNTCTQKVRADNARAKAEQAKQTEKAEPETRKLA